MLYAVGVIVCILIALIVVLSSCMLSSRITQAEERVRRLH